MTYNLLFKNLDELKIKGLGKANIVKLNKLHVYTLYDLLYFFPRAYEDRSNSKNIAEILPEEFVVLKGKILKASNQYIKGGRYMYRAWFGDDTGVVELTWFNNRYIQKNISIGDELLVYGKVKKGIRLQIVNPEYKKLESIEIVPSSQILPIYSSTSSLKQPDLRKIIHEAILNFGYILEENLPEELTKKEKLLSRKDALINVHFPENEKLKQKALQRFMLEEIFVLEMGILQSRFEVDKANTGLYKIENKKTLVKKFIEELSFDLTNAQKRVIKEIYNELVKGKIVNRLIQGDVGSGKTIVSLIMLLYMVENGYQGAIMAPTEILATQHYLGIVDEFNNLNVRVELLTGSIKGKKREKLLKEIEEGLVDIVIGTHALIEKDIVFKNLGLVIIDEQHRFGVVQRKLLRDKGEVANLIVMSATPIPRSLALTIYGDLDVSIIDELPAGRKQIKTKWIKEIEEKKVMYKFIDDKIEEGRQIYVVSPLIEESETLNVKSALATYEEYLDIYKNRRLGLIHGKLKSKEKQEVMEEFRKGNIDILVATTVIEVGVNVPNASIMVIRDAQRYG